MNLAALAAASRGDLANALLAAAPQPAAQAESAQGVPDGFTLVSTDTLAGWKVQVNTLAVLSGQDRRERTIKLKQEIADVLAAAPQPAAQQEPKPYDHPDDDPWLSGDDMMGDS